MEELQEFERYVAHLSQGLGHADRHAGLRGYCTGLMAPLKRKSIEPMASHLAPMATRSRHQSLHHFVANSAWSAAQMLLRIAQWVVPAMDLLKSAHDRCRQKRSLRSSSSAFFFSCSNSSCGRRSKHDTTNNFATRPPQRVRGPNRFSRTSGTCQ